jgi:hypothetical protein
MQLQRGAAVPLDVTLSALDDSGVLAQIVLGPSTVEAPGAQSAEEFAKAAQAVGAKQERDTGRVQRRDRQRATAKAGAGAGGGS